MTEIEYVKLYPFTFGVTHQSMVIGFRVCSKCGNHLENWSRDDGADQDDVRVPMHCLADALLSHVKAALLLLHVEPAEGWELLQLILEYRHESAEVLDKRRLH